MAVVAQGQRTGDIFGQVRGGGQPRLDSQWNDMARERLLDRRDARALNGDRPAGGAAHAAVAARVWQMKVEPEKFHESSSARLRRAIASFTISAFPPKAIRICCGAWKNWPGTAMVS